MRILVFILVGWGIVLGVVCIIEVIMLERYQSEVEKLEKNYENI